MGVLVSHCVLDVWSHWSVSRSRNIACVAVVLLCCVGIARVLLWTASIDDSGTIELLALVGAHC